MSHYSPRDPETPAYIPGHPDTTGWYTDKAGSQVHFVAGEIHRDDGPAVIRNDGSEAYYQHNLIGRRDPGFSVTVMDEEGRIKTQMMHKNGRLQSENGKPALVEYTYAEGDLTPSLTTHYYYQDDQLSRTGAPAIEVYQNKTKTGKDAQKPTIIYAEFRDMRFGGLHRLGGPAVVTPTLKEYYYANKRHREDGPAVEGRGGEEFWLSGKQTSRKVVMDLYASGKSQMGDLARDARQALEDSGIQLDLAAMEGPKSTQEERVAKARAFVLDWVKVNQGKFKSRP